MTFDHVGFRSYEKREGEFYYAPNKVWITDSEKHPLQVEWLRYEADSPVQEPVKSSPHIAFRVENLEKESNDMELLLGPMIIDIHTRVAFYRYNDGTIVELMEITP